MTTFQLVVLVAIIALPIGVSLGSAAIASYWAGHVDGGPVHHAGVFYYVVSEYDYLQMRAAHRDKQTTAQQGRVAKS